MLEERIARIELRAAAGSVGVGFAIVPTDAVRAATTTTVSTTTTSTTAPGTRDANAPAV